MSTAIIPPGSIPATMVPFIPDDAPFSNEQRVWLNGFLAGLFSSAPVQASAQPQAIAQTVHVYFASQSGTAERLAKKLTKELKGAGHTATVEPIDAATPEILADTAHAAFLVSTYGDGEPPDHARAFYDALLAADEGSFARLRYTVLCLGDRNYEQFCQFGIELDERLAALGAQRLHPRVESDVEVEQPFGDWKSGLLERLAATDDTAKSSAMLGAASITCSTGTDAARYTRDMPFHAVLKQRSALTRGDSSKLTMHLAFALDEHLRYEAGDACGMIAQNDTALVADTLALLPFGADAVVDIPKLGSCTMEQALSHHLQHSRLTRKMVQGFAERSGAESLHTLLRKENSEALEAFLWDRGLIDLLEAYPGCFQSAGELVALLPRLSPRLYSISSSPAAHAGELHCTIAVVRYHAHNRQRGGVASTMLADRVEVGATVPIYIQTNHRFRIPSDAATPMIMIGPGTGIAPFRSFLHERRALGHNGRNWLFFGERSANSDFLYCEELRTMMDDGTLSRLDTAFSRDQAHKVYVQDRMIEHGAELWQWLEQGGRVYVCGDASRMAKDVDAALHKIVETHGGMSEDAAQEYVAAMHENNRYHRDVY